MQSQAHPLIAKIFSASFLPWLRICKRLPTVLVCFPKAWASHFGATMDFISYITPLSARINASKFQNSSKIPLKIPGLWKNGGDQSLATISRPNFGLKILTKLQLQNLDQTVVNTFLSINISNTTNIKKLWVGIFKGQSHISQVHLTGLSVSLTQLIVS